MVASDDPVTRADLIGWTPQMVLYNTLGTIIGGVAGLAALVIAMVALLR